MYALWQHYQCHQETEPSDTYTFWNFLLEHYASKHNFQTEASHSHQQLPFQHFAAGLCALPPIAIPVFPVKENIIERQSPHAIQFFHSTLPIDGPFRPPVA